MAVLTLALLAGCAGPGVGAAATGPESVLPDGQVAPLLESLERVSSSTPALHRLAEGLLPPTNRWYSGLVFGDEPQPVFPLPLSFSLTETGYAFGLPTTLTGPGLITAPAEDQVSLDLGADEAVVTRYDDVSVTVSLRRSGESLGRVTIARGSPIVSFVADTAVAIRSSVALTAIDNGYATAEGEQRFGLSVIGATVEGSSLSLKEGDSANFYAVPPSTDHAALASLAASPLTGVATSWRGTSTRLDYGTVDGSETLIGVLPQQWDRLVTPKSCDLGSFATIYGELRLCAGSRLEWSVPALEPSSSLALDDLDDAERAEILSQLGEDLATTKEIPADSYFGGKALARLATLLELAQELGDKGTAATALERLTAELSRWSIGPDCSERCFVYDPIIGGIVALPASFGSEQFNDHHFHYGYFLYAAGIAVKADPELASRFTSVMTLLAADIASGATTSHFPARRTFDPYSGHSWASGYAPFADGNNQESSSEAVAAWNGLALWAAAIGDEALESEARWMLASEAAAASRYWLGFDRGTAPYEGYDNSVAGIIWDGKLEYGTWFSADPGAVLGIQLLPMQPVADYLAGDTERIKESVAEAETGTLFPDYRLMYESLAGVDVVQAARDLPQAAIDDGNSRSYLLAWVMGH